jgi:hypothetical protein
VAKNAYCVFPRCQCVLAPIFQKVKTRVSQHPSRIVRTPLRFRVSPTYSHGIQCKKHTKRSASPLQLELIDRSPKCVQRTTTGARTRL